VLLFEEPVFPVADAEHETSDDEESQKARADAHERDRLVLIGQLRPRNVRTRTLAKGANWHATLT
jgi:hypothetical protein